MIDAWLRFERIEPEQFRLPQTEEQQAAQQQQAGRPNMMRADQAAGFFAKAF